MTLEEKVEAIKGTRVELINDHPWGGHIGEVLGHERTPVGWMWRIKLLTTDHDQECFAKSKDLCALQKAPLAP